MTRCMFGAGHDIGPNEKFVEVVHSVLLSNGITLRQFSAKVYCLEHWRLCISLMDKSLKDLEKP